MRQFVVAAAVLGGIAAGSIAATPASALPMAHPLGAEAGQSRAESVALYCNNRGKCIRVKRPGYVYRSAPVVVRPAPYVRPGVVVRGGGPDVKVKIRP